MFYVIMADIVGSSEASSVPKLAKAFERLVKRCNEWNKSEIISPLTITLGDEFQGILKSECSFYKVITWLEENKWQEGVEISLRYVLEFDKIETEINREIAHGMLGSALTNARQRLSGLKEEKGQWFAIGDKIAFAELKQIQVNLYLSLLRGWKWKDKDLIYNLLEWRDYKVVAEKLNKTRSLVWKRSNSLDMDKYFDLKRTLELMFCI